MMDSTESIPQTEKEIIDETRIRSETTYVLHIESHPEIRPVLDLVEKTTKEILEYLGLRKGPDVVIITDSDSFFISLNGEKIPVLYSHSSLRAVFERFLRGNSNKQNTAVLLREPIDDTMSLEIFRLGRTHDVPLSQEEEITATLAEEYYHFKQNQEEKIERPTKLQTLIRKYFIVGGEYSNRKHEKEAKSFALNYLAQKYPTKFGFINSGGDFAFDEVIFARKRKNNSKRFGHWGHWRT